MRNSERDRKPTNNARIRATVPVLKDGQVSSNEM